MAKKKPSLRKPAAKSKKSMAVQAAAKVKKPGSKARLVRKKKPKGKPAPAKKKPASRTTVAARKKAPAKKPRPARKKAPSRKPALPMEALERDLITPPLPEMDSDLLPTGVIIEETIVAETFIPTAPATKLQLRLPVLPFIGPANVNRATGTICTQGVATDQFGRGPIDVRAEVFAHNPEPIAPGSPPDSGATPGMVSGITFTVDPLPGAVCAEPPNPPITQYIVVWIQMQDGTWCHITQPFAGQCAAANDCGD